MAMETGSGVQEVHRDGCGGGASLRGRYHLLCLCLGLLLRIYSQSQRQFAFLSCIMSLVHASVAYSMSLEKVPISAARSQLHTLSRLGKIDIQVIFKLQVAIASPRIAETTKWTIDERWDCGSFLWGRIGSVGEMLK